MTSTVARQPEVSTQRDRPSGDASDRAAELLAGEPAYDWNDLRTAGAQARKLLAELDRDRSLLDALLVRCGKDERLLSMCERHVPFDKIVLADEPARHFRIRLHLWRQTTFERAHSHRFSFASHMLEGSYRHTIYSFGDTVPRAADEAVAHQHSDPDNPDRVSDVDLDLIEPILEYDMRGGESYVLHHTAIHSTQVDAGALTLILRGPAEKKTAFVANLDQRSVYWRQGRQAETQERASARTMSTASFASIVEELRTRSGDGQYARDH